MSEVLNHPLMVLRDTHGAPWHVFDLDGTITTFRRRSLPQSTELPEAQRDLGDEIARPGYTGRKRGEVQLCRSTLAHLGSGAWLGVWLKPGNEDATEVPAHAAALVAKSALDAGIEPSQCLIRFDGLYGGWLIAKASRLARIRYLLRWKSSYALLNDPGVKQQLEGADWHLVKSSLSGPTRYATELGVQKNSDHSLSTRLMVSRYLDTGKDGDGVVIGGYRYELFGTSLEQDAFPAAETVALYYGRVAQENRFGQEDREHQLDHLFSTNLGGQHLAVLIGLFLWNMRIRRGLDLVESQLKEHPLPDPVPRQDFLQPKTEQGLENHALSATAVQQDEPINPHKRLIEALGRLDWDSLLTERGLWSWSSQGLCCPAGKAMPLKRVIDSGETFTLIFRACRGVCSTCTLRGRCTESTKPSYRKEMQVTIAQKEGKEISRLKAMRLPTTWNVPTDSGPVEVTCLEAPDDIPPGQSELSGPHLVPSVLRHEVRKRCLGLAVNVLALVPPPEKNCPAFAANAEERQRRRLTWEARNAWNELPSDACVQLLFRAASQSEADILLNMRRRPTKRKGRAA